MNGQIGDFEQQSNYFMEKTNKNPLVSIITVNYNGLNHLKLLFESFRRVKYAPLEIILVDNASNDESVAFTRKYFPEIVVLDLDQNYMFARANNEGIKKARGEICCLINNDVVVDPNFIEPVVKAFSKNDQLGICQSKVLDLKHPNCFEYAGAAGGFIDRYGYPFMRGRIFFTTEHDEGQYDQDLEIFWASGACFFIRKSVLAESGYLDEDFILHMEEIDLCWRIHLMGWHIRTVTASKIWHQGGGTLSAENPRKVYWNYRNNIFLLVKNLSFLNLIKLWAARIFLDSAALFAEIGKGKPKNSLAIIQAYFWILFHFLLVWRKRQDVQKRRKINDSQIWNLMYPGSIVWEYFVRARKKFSELKYVDQLVKNAEQW